ncbi:hypothetical protein Btru_037724 [Bulinus truncatus]|nr:hypothetical protein Btru_037724 [Bulinus truncatus]
MKQDLKGNLTYFNMVTVWFTFSIGFLIENCLIAIIASACCIRRFIFLRGKKNDQIRDMPGYDQLDLHRDNNQHTQPDLSYETLNASKENVEKQKSLYDEPMIRPSTMGGANSKRSKSKTKGNKAKAKATHVAEASKEKGRLCQVILPNETQIEKRAYTVQSAAEYREDCLGRSYPNINSYDVVLWVDEQHEIVMRDDDEFGENLFEFDHIIIRERPEVCMGVVYLCLALLFLASVQLSECITHMRSNLCVYTSFEIDV